MADQASVEYRAYKIVWSDNGDHWHCWDLEYQSPKLSAVKARIDAVYLALRKRSAVKAYEIDATAGYGAPRLRECTIIDYGKEKWEKPWSYSGGKREEYFKGHEVFSMAVRTGKEGRRSRRGIMLHELAPIGPETDAAFAKVEAAFAVLVEAKKAYETTVNDIPRVQIEDIADLIRASKTKLEEGDKV